jgi:hypothetical protein
VHTFQAKGPVWNNEKEIIKDFVKKSIFSPLKIEFDQPYIEQDISTGSLILRYVSNVNQFSDCPLKLRDLACIQPSGTLQEDDCKIIVKQFVQM